MIRTTEYDCAASISFYADYGTFGLKDGTIVRGPIDTIESAYDEPNGIGCIDIVTNDVKNYGTSVYADQFAWAEFPDSLFPRLPERLRSKVKSDSE